MAISFPAKQSVGALLLYLIVGDIIATIYYRKSADLTELKKLIPWVAIGIFIGLIILNTINDTTLKNTLGVLIILLVIGEIFRSQFKLNIIDMKGIPFIGVYGETQESGDTPAPPSSPYSASTWLRITVGVAAGIATAIGNAAGPIMAIYLLLTKLNKNSFMGTTALFFLIVNLSKVPAFVYLKIIQPSHIYTFLLTFPFILIGAIIGKRFLKHISTSAFNILILVFTAIAGLLLLIT